MDIEDQSQDLFQEDDNEECFQQNHDISVDPAIEENTENMMYEDQQMEEHLQEEDVTLKVPAALRSIFFILRNSNVKNPLGRLQVFEGKSTIK